MSNDFYEASGTPAQRSQGASSPMRAEFSDIELGFNKLPLLTGNANKPVVINAGATALTTVAQLPPAQGGTGAGVLTQGQVVFAGALGIYAGSNNLFWDNTNVGLGIGTTSLLGSNLRIVAPLTGNASAANIACVGEVQTDANVAPTAYLSYPTFSATVGTYTNFIHFSAAVLNVGGATISNHYGFLAAASIGTGSTVASGFASLLAAGTNKWNFYATGTAANAFQGNTRIGSIVAPTVPLDVTGDLIASGQATIAATAPVSAIATTKLWITGDTTFVGGNHALMGNLYYDGAWKYTAGGASAGAVKLAADTATAMQFLSAPNNAGAAGAAATMTVAASISSAGVFNITTATITTGTITNPTFTNPPTIASLGVNNVLFMAAAGVVSQDGNFQYDSANNRLGVGTATLPTLAHLTVQGNTAAGSVVDAVLISNTSSSTLGHGARLYLSGSLTPTRAVYIEGVNTGGASNAHDMVLGTSAASASPVERMRITSGGDIYFKDTAAFWWSNAEVLAIGGTPAPHVVVRLSKGLVHSGGVSYGLLNDGIIQTGSTSSANIFYSSASVAASAPVGQLRHYVASPPATFSSVVTSQYGFLADSGLQGATSNYGFYGNIAAASGRWNFMAAGTALNAFVGATRFGSATAPTSTVDITGTLAVSSTSVFTGTSTFNGNLDANAYIAVNGTPTTGTSLLVGPPPVSATTQQELLHLVGTLPSTPATYSVDVVHSNLTMPDAAYTLTTINHFMVTGLTKPATPGLTNQRGFLVNSTMTGATSQNIGFYGNLPVSAINWNFFGAGAAQNAFVGMTRFGSAVAPTVAVDITGALSVSTNAIILGDVGLAAASTIGWSGRANITSPADAMIHLYNAAFTIGVRLSTTADGTLNVLTTAGAGGTVVAATYNSTTLIQARSSSVVAAASVAQCFIKASTTANYGIYYGTGVPAFAAAVSSLYLRNDGAANTRLYICTVAAGTWAAVTTP
jgi:hypothetical protein